MMYRRESEIMALWDQGHSIEQISAQTPYSITSIRGIISQYGCCGFDDQKHRSNMINGSEKLARALRQYQHERRDHARS